MDNTLRKNLADHVATVQAMFGMLAQGFDPAATLMAEAIANDHKVLFCGNGGSAADAMHLAAELVVRFKVDRKAYPGIALTADNAILTACANDYGYARIFCRQVEAIGRAGDVLVAISTSGKSVNVLEAIAAAKRLGIGTIGLSGAHPMNCDVDLPVPSIVTARIQEMHLLIGHCLIQSLEERLPP